MSGPGLPTEVLCLLNMVRKTNSKMRKNMRTFWRISERSAPSMERLGHLRFLVLYLVSMYQELERYLLNFARMGNVRKLSTLSLEEDSATEQLLQVILTQINIIAENSNQHFFGRFECELNDHLLHWTFEFTLVMIVLCYMG